jgi:hypothetical protein
MKCINPACNSTELVYSGTDAFVLGITTEKWCYTCANAIAEHRRQLEKV